MGAMKGTPHLGFGLGFILSLLSGSNRVIDPWMVQIITYQWHASSGHLIAFRNLSFVLSEFSNLFWVIWSHQADGVSG